MRTKPASGWPALLRVRAPPAGKGLSMPVEDIFYPLLKRYMAAPQWLKSSLGNCYAALPAGIRYGRNYATYVKELAAHDEAAILALEALKLGQTLTWALETVPAYASHRHLLTRRLAPQELLQELPFVSKEEIKQNLDAYLSTALPENLRMEMFTGGSTANPMKFYLERNSTRPKESAFIADFKKRLSVGRRDIILTLRGRTVNRSGEPDGRFWMYEPINRQLILSSDHLEPQYMPSYLSALRKWRPAFIHAFPSALYPLVRWLLDNPAPDVTETVRGIMLTSENVYDYQMQLFRRIFSCPVLKHYGHSERVLMAASTVDDERYLFWPQYGKFELVDPSGRPVTDPGVLGEIVGTSFDNRVMPFVRYRTGDFAVLGACSNPQLPGYPVCERIEGRLQEFVVCRDRRLISITTLGAAHFGELTAVDAIQYEQFTPGFLRLKYQSNEELSPLACADIARAVSAKTQSGCDVEIQRVEAIPRTERGKHKMMVQHIDISGYLGASAVE